MRSHRNESRGDEISPALAASVPDALYRLVFVGGPFDGHETQSAFLPDEYFRLRSPMTARDRETGPPHATRLAQYRLTKSNLVMCSQEPVLLYRFDFCGMVAGNLSKASWWRRCLPESWQ
jgi:hypothetical protein